MDTPYRFNGRPGCVTQVKSSQNGNLIGVYDAAQRGMREDIGPWVTVCEGHRQLVTHDTLEIAMSHLHDSVQWCGHCHDEAQLVITKPTVATLRAF